MFGHVRSRVRTHLMLALARTSKGSWLVMRDVAFWSANPPDAFVLFPRDGRVVGNQLFETAALVNRVSALLLIGREEQHGYLQYLLKMNFLVRLTFGGGGEEGRPRAEGVTREGMRAGEGRVMRRCIDCSCA